MAADLNVRASKAFRAMNRLGISDETVKPVLRRLLKLYDKNWDMIEEENYRTLADAIFEHEDDKVEQKTAMTKEDAEPLRKRPHTEPPENQALKTLKTGKKIAELDNREFPKNFSSSGKKVVESSRSFSNTESPHNANMAPVGNKAKNPIKVEVNKPCKIASIAHSSNPSSNEPGLKPIVTEKKRSDENRNAIENWRKKTIDYSTQSARPGSSTRPGPIDAQQHSDNQKKNRRPSRRVHDIANGTEKLEISLVDETGNECRPKFTYIPENLIYQSAYVNISLARIAEDDCCRNCRGDCLSSSFPCECARDTGGEYAYTSDGLLNEAFLDSCISMNQCPEKRHLVFCQDCPLERVKGSNLHQKCNGHLLKKFIRECWRICGCNMRCGNRVVQRGMTRKLEVFITSKAIGWGVRALEELPKGAFVCEYAGEILTNIELYERNMTNKAKEEKHTYPVLLDADWGTEGVLKDEESLCLDATRFGNVARFINHRCYDSNLIEIPVQVETPDRHYYHVAFFTKRKVEALEELTWDYGIDFDDHNHPIKAFQCQCKSKYCRDKNRIR